MLKNIFKNHKIIHPITISFVSLIIIGSSLEGTSIPKSHIFTLDKLLHVIEYFIFGILLYFSFTHFTKHPIILTLILGAFYSFIDEFYQSTVQGRTSSALDIIADIFGLILSAFFVKFFFNSIENDKKANY
tara:strand:+ start:78 stop:470 length:393 start_codon:yes stop_codon:yes gene_type:complete